MCAVGTLSSRTSTRLSATTLRNSAARSSSATGRPVWSPPSATRNRRSASAGSAGPRFRHSRAGSRRAARPGSRRRPAGRTRGPLSSCRCRPCRSERRRPDRPWGQVAAAPAAELHLPAHDLHLVDRQLRRTADRHVAPLHGRSAPDAIAGAPGRARPLLSRPKLRTWLEAELLVHQRAHRAESARASARLPATTRVRSGPPEGLVEGVVVGDRLERRKHPPRLWSRPWPHELGGRQPGRDPVRLDRCQQRLQGPLRRHAAPARLAASSSARPRRGGAVSGQQRPELEQVEVVGGDAEPVAAAGRGRRTPRADDWSAPAPASAAVGRRAGGRR